MRGEKIIAFFFQAEGHLSQLDGNGHCTTMIVPSSPSPATRTVQRCGCFSSLRNLDSCGITDTDVDSGLLQDCFDKFGPSNIESL